MIGTRFSSEIGDRVDYRAVGLLDRMVPSKTIIKQIYHGLRCWEIPLDDFRDQIQDLCERSPSEYFRLLTKVSPSSERRVYYD